jgi:hypothetical protein
MKPNNIGLYNRVRKMADNVYSKPSAYKSGFIVRKYKELGGTFARDGKPKTLKRWFREKWTDVGHRSYPVYRPTVRVTRKTPLLASEIDSRDLKRKIRLKQSIRGTRNLPPFMGKKGEN